MAAAVLVGLALIVVMPPAAALLVLGLGGWLFIRSAIGRTGELDRRVLLVAGITAAALAVHAAAAIVQS